MKSAVKILGRDWDVYRTPFNAAMLHQNIGLCCSSDQTLNIADCHPEKMDTIFLHELLHAILEDQQVSLEESQISIISAGLYATFRDNGWMEHFFDWKSVPVYLGRGVPEEKGDKICAAHEWEKMRTLPTAGRKANRGSPRRKRGSKRSKRNST